jgi:hypothetical protein
MLGQAAKRIDAKSFRRLKTDRKLPILNSVFGAHGARHGIIPTLEQQNAAA